MGECRVSGSRLARTLTLVRWSQIDSPLYPILGPPLHNSHGGSDRQMLEEHRDHLSHTRRTKATVYLPLLPLHLLV